MGPPTGGYNSRGTSKQTAQVQWSRPPIKVWVVDSLEQTSTFKSKKSGLRKQGYEIDIEDPLYVLKGRDEGYVAFCNDYPDEVAAGSRPKD